MGERKFLYLLIPVLLLYFSIAFVQAQNSGIHVAFHPTCDEGNIEALEMGRKISDILEEMIKEFKMRKKHECEYKKNTEIPKEFPFWIGKPKENYIFISLHKSDSNKILYVENDETAKKLSLILMREIELKDIEVQSVNCPGYTDLCENYYGGTSISIRINLDDQDKIVEDISNTIEKYTRSKEIVDGEKGSPCQKHTDCKENYACRPTFSDVSFKKACCNPYKMWDGEKCSESKMGENCFTGSCENIDNLKCNPTINGSEKRRVCCRNKMMWDEKRGKCKYGEYGDRCENEWNCKKSTEIQEQLASLFAGELHCNPTLTGTNYFKVCCPGNTLYDPKTQKCRKGRIGERCEKDENCKSSIFGKKLNCNPTTGNLINYQKACCPGNRIWNGSDCIEKDEINDDVEYLENCKSGSYSRYTCNSGKPEYNKQLDVCDPLVKQKIEEWVLSDEYLKSQVLKNRYDNAVRKIWEKSYELSKNRYCLPACTGNKKSVIDLLSKDISCGTCNHWAAVGTSLIRTLGVPPNRVYSIGYFAPGEGYHASTAYKSDNGEWWILDYTCCERLVKASNWESCGGCTCLMGDCADNDYYSGPWETDMFGGICYAV
ncbi:MAG: hypothetical protein ABEK17_01675 [Candidatus Aenigmatarchaeota archaeon]